MTTFSEAQIMGYVGKSIGEICSNHFDSTTENHCAHFVSHALGISLATLCGDLKFNTRRTGATIRCDELFNNLTERGAWNSHPQNIKPLLIFIISAQYMSNNIMHPVPQKHVGIFFGSAVYNYSGQHKSVISDHSVDSFYQRINSVYYGDDISMYYGVP